jgi:hypothetical protein
MRGINQGFNYLSTRRRSRLIFFQLIFKQISQIKICSSLSSMVSLTFETELFINNEVYHYQIMVSDHLLTSAVCGC